MTRVARHSRDFTPASWLAGPGRYLAPMLACLGAALGSDVPLSDIDEGRALAREIRSAPPPESLDVSGLIRVRKEDGRRSVQPFHYRVVTGEKTWQHIYETVAVGSHPSELLVITHHDDSPPAYHLTRQGGRPSDPVQHLDIRGDAAMIPFAGSDFWLADLGLEFLHWPEQRIDRNTRLSMRKGRSCRVLESVNPKIGAAGYTRVRSWVDIKTRGIIIAEAYGANNRLMKEFEIGGFTKVDQNWVLKNMEIRDLISDTRTILEFNYEGAE